MPGPRNHGRKSNKYSQHRRFSNLLSVEVTAPKLACDVLQRDVLAQQAGAGQIGETAP